MRKKCMQEYDDIVLETRLHDSREACLLSEAHLADFPGRFPCGSLGATASHRATGIRDMRQRCTNKLKLSLMASVHSWQCDGRNTNAAMHGSTFKSQPQPRCPIHSPSTTGKIFKTSNLRGCSSKLEGTRVASGTQKITLHKKMAWQYAGQCWPTFTDCSQALQFVRRTHTFLNLANFSSNEEAGGSRLLNLSSREERSYNTTIKGSTSQPGRLAPLPGHHMQAISTLRPRAPHVNTLPNWWTCDQASPRHNERHKIKKQHPQTQAKIKASTDNTLPSSRMFKQF